MDGAVKQVSSELQVTQQQDIQITPYSECVKKKNKKRCLIVLIIREI